MMTGSISENRVSIPMPPPVLGLLRSESRILGITVPALVRHVLMNWANANPRYKIEDTRGKGF